MDTHLLHIYTGNGKGKTTAAMGQALRVLGHNKKVVIAQLMKDGTTGELKSLGSLPGAVIYDGFIMKGFLRTRTEAERQLLRDRHREALEKLIELLEKERPALTVLDELNVALAMGLVSPEDARRLIDVALRTGDCIATGRHAGESLIAQAAYVTRMEAVKHPFDEGQPAREGIEY